MSSSDEEDNSCPSKRTTRLFMFLVGIFMVCTVALAAALVIKQTGSGYSYNDEGISSPLVPPEEFEFKLPTSQLGIYTKAAVATDTRPCAKVGVDIFRKNGTAVDAAIATLVCNGAVHAHSLGLGGGFFMTIFIKSEGKSYFLNAREMAPLAATRDMFVGNPKASSQGPLAIGIPGELKGYFEAKTRFGNPNLSMLDLMQPTINLCQNGFKITRSLERAINMIDVEDKFDQNLREEYTNPETGKLYKSGEVIKRPQYAQTLLKIGQNGTADIFYQGPIGGKMVEEVQKLGGILTMEDLKRFSAKWEDPLEFVINGKKLVTTSAPGSGCIVGGILKLLTKFTRMDDFKDKALNYHRFIEASKFAFAQRSKLGDWRNDPEIQGQINETVSYLQSQDWLTWVMSKWNDLKTTRNSQFYGAEYQYSLPEDHGTSHISILGPNGDAVSVTSTVNSYFGSGIMSKSSRIVLNNQMDDFSTPDAVNIYGIAPSAENFIKPLKRPLSSMAPSIVLDKDNLVKLVIGASGGPRIISAIAYVTMRHLWMDEDIKTAIDAPRPHHQLIPMTTFVEIGTDQKVLKSLKTKGHKVEVVDVYFAANYGGARVQGVSVSDNGIITANNDRRKEGEVDGY